MNNSTIPGSTDATGLFTAKNPHIQKINILDNECLSDNPDYIEHERQYPPLFCYNENNQLVKGVEGLEVTEGHRIEHTKGWSLITDSEYDFYENTNAKLQPCYIAVQPTEKASVSNVEAIENSVRELINSLPGYEANVKLQQFYKAIYEAGRKQGAANQEKLMQVNWVKVSELEALVDRLKNPNGFIECTPYGLITEIKKLRNKQQ